MNEPTPLRTNVAEAAAPVAAMIVEVFNLALKQARAEMAGGGDADTRRGFAPDQLTVDAAKLAQRLDVSLRTIRRLDSEAKLPRAVDIGGRAKRWRVAEIEAWLQNGSPDRETWEEISRHRNWER